MNCQLLTRIFGALIFSFALLSHAHAATHCVRAGASGNGSGADWTNAYTQLPSALVRGDTYYIAAGSYGPYSFDDPAAGTQLITIKKATVSDHAPGSGWNDTFATGQAQFPSLAFNTDYFVFDGLTGGGVGNWTTGHGFKIASTISSGSGALVTFGAGADFITVSHTEVTALNVNDANKMSGFKGTSGNGNLVFSYNYVHTMFGVPFHIGSWHDVLIEQNYIAHNRNTPDWHTEGISSIGTNNEITIRFNIWDHIEGTGVFAGVNTGTSNSWKIYGNVISNSVTPVAYYYEPSPSTNQQTMNNLEFYNNVLTGIRASQGGIFIQQGSNNKVYNNIWYDNDINALEIAGTKLSNYFSKNIRTSDCNPPCAKDSDGAAGDPSAQITSVNPFVNWTTSMEASLGNFHLNAPTSAGTVLLSPYNIDPSGVVRGADGNWDRGVFEFSPADSIPPASPSNLRIP